MRYRNLLLLLLGGRLVVAAAPPAGYYDSAQGKAGGELRTALHNLIRNHHVIPYSSSGFDTSDALKILDADPGNASNVLLIYGTDSVSASTFGLTTGWNREHQWCNSYGIDSVGPAYSDLFNLRAVDANVNSSRGNKYYDFSDTNSAGYKLPAHAEAPLCSTDSDSWQPPVFDWGNIARSMFYMAIRYTGDATNEPVLVLTDNTALIQSSNYYMGDLSTLLAWHSADPVDTAEQLRNDQVYSLYQTNRNPFVDHPEWVNLTFAPAHTNPPILNIEMLAARAVLSWLATNQSCHLEFSTNSASTWLTVTNTPMLTNSQFRVSLTTDTPSVWFRLRVQQ